jgi:ferrous iron transport protein B
MFAALSVLEDSGYMSRAAYVMDRFMRTIGLPGKSFVPMMVGFGCTVPAILGTRTLESRRDRYMTIFMAPNMSCGARLPVYALFAAAFFPDRSGLVVFSLYVVGIAVAIGTGFFLKVTLLRGEPSHFIMELPPYHAPRFRFVMTQAWQRLSVFVKRAGITITLIVTVLSLLNMAAIGGPSVSATSGAAATAEAPPTNDASGDRTVLGVVSRAITPVFGPMGITNENWAATVALVTGIFAKEAVVGTLSSLYGQQQATTPEEFTLGPAILGALTTIPDNLAGIGRSIAGRPAADGGESDAVATTVFDRLRQQFTRQSAYAYLLFVLIYLPCAAALATAIREMGALLGWLLAAYSTLLAWSIATLYYQIASGPQLLDVILPFVVMGVVAVAFRVVGTRVIAQRLKSAPPPGHGNACAGCTACGDRGEPRDR